jgi:hypothetical protein
MMKSKRSIQSTFLLISFWMFSLVAWSPVEFQGVVVEQLERIKYLGLDPASDFNAALLGQVVEVEVVMESGLFLQLPFSDPEQTRIKHLLASDDLSDVASGLTLITSKADSDWGRVRRVGRDSDSEFLELEDAFSESNAETVQQLQLVLAEIKPALLAELVDYYKSHQANLESPDSADAEYYAGRFVSDRSQRFDNWTQSLGVTSKIPLNWIKYFWKEMLEKDEEFSLEFVQALALSQEEFPDNLGKNVPEIEVPSVPVTKAPPTQVESAQVSPVTAPLVGSTLVAADAQKPVEQEADLEQLRADVAKLSGRPVASLAGWTANKLRETRARLSLMK